MNTFKYWAIAIVGFYVIPLIVGVIFAFLHNKENPFRKNNTTTDWVFMPVMNFACMVAIIFFVCYKCVTCMYTFVKNILNRIRKWNRN